MFYLFRKMIDSKYYNFLNVEESKLDPSKTNFTSDLVLYF